MQSPPALKLVEAPTSSDERVRQLLAERARSEAELQRLAQVSGRRTDAEARLATIDGEISALDSADVGAWRAWAANPDGDGPTPRREERRALAERRFDAECDLDGARVAGAAIAERYAAIAASLKSIGENILELRLALAVDEAIKAHGDAAELAAQLAKTLMRVLSLRNLCQTEIGREQGSGENRRAEIFAAALQKVLKLIPPEVVDDRATMASETALWREKLQ